MRYFLYILSILFFISCGQNQASKKDFYSKGSASNGKKLMENKCYVCHSPTAKSSSRVAPPMVAIKNHYLNDGTTKEEFINSIQNWIKNPTHDKVKMPGAVKKFGIMPKQVFAEEDISKIAAYMYDTDLKGPGWHRKQLQEKQEAYSSSTPDSTFAALGLKYALATKSVLGQNLMQQVQQNGTVAAVSFCNVKALPLTDSVAIAKGVSISRVSDKPRNQKNKASLKEEEIINSFKADITNNTEVKPLVVKENQQTLVYYPITTNGLCLQCHGSTKNQIKDDTYSMLEKLYPKDKAVGYAINQIRGVWKVEFKEQSNE